MAAFNPAAYRSPLENDPRVVTLEMEGWTATIIEDGAATLMPSPDPLWPPEVSGVYLARRDANLIGFCPACGAVGPAVVVGQVQHGSMIHEHDCLVSDSGIRRTLAWHWDCAGCIECRSRA